MKNVKISDIVEIFNGYAFDSDAFNSEGKGLPIIRIRDIVPGYSETYYSGEYPKDYLIDNGALLVGMDGEFNIEFWKGGKALLNQRVCQIIPKDSVADILFLKYRLSILLKRIEAETPFVTVKYLSSEKLKDEVIELPPLTEQKRIASLLARADHLRQLRWTAHDLGDALLQSVFLEMFYNRESKWELSTVEDLAKKKNNAFRTGPFGSQLLHSEFTETGDVLVLGIDNAVQNEFSWGKPRYITTEKYQELKRYTVFPGDLIITIMATNGRVAVVPDNIPLAINTKHLCCITLDQKICLPKFLQACFLYHPDILKQMGGSERGTVMPGMNMEIIKNLVVPVPPLSKQEEFAGVVARVESLRGRMGASQSTRQVEGLFESLLAESFELKVYSTL